MAVNVDVKAKEKPNQGGVKQFFKGLKAEIKRMTWPSKKDIKKATIAVGSFTVLYVIFVGLLDVGFNNLCELIFKLK